MNVHFRDLHRRPEHAERSDLILDALSQYIFANFAAYRRKANRNTFNSNDELALQDAAHGGFCDISEQADHYLATLVVGVSRTIVTALGQPARLSIRLRTIIPGVAAEKQKNSSPVIRRNNETGRKRPQPIRPAENSAGFDFS